MMEREIRKCLTFIMSQISSKIFGEIMPKSLQFQKDSSSPRMTEKIQILQRRLECFSRDLKVLWIA